MHKNLTSLIVFAASGVALGCSDAPVGPSGEGDLGYSFARGKADGEQFGSRPLAPIEVSADGSSTSGTILDEEDGWNAYTFDVADPAQLDVRLVWSFADRVENLWGILHPGNEARAQLALFRHNPEAGPETNGESWDLVVDTRVPAVTNLGNRDELDERFEPARTGGINPSLLHEVLTPGRFMVLILGNDPAVWRESNFWLEVDASPTGAEERSAGQVEVQLFVEDGRLGAGVRVGLSTSSAVTDENGFALLENVPAGEHEIKFGDTGEGRLYNSEDGDFWVTGNGATNRFERILWVGNYESWTNGR